MTMKRIMFVLIFLAAVVAIGALGYHAYRDRAARDRIDLAIKTTTLRVSDSLEYVRAGSRISYAEFLQLLMRRAAEIGDGSIELRAIGDGDHVERLLFAVEYMRKSQELLRAQHRYTNQRLIAGNASERSSEAVAELKAARGYGASVQLRIAESAANSADRELKKAMESLDELKKTLKEFSDYRNERAAMIGDHLLVSAVLLEAVAKQQ